MSMPLIGAAALLVLAANADAQERRRPRKEDDPKKVAPLTASMHPRVSNGVTIHKKVNTSKKPSRAVLMRKLAAVEAHMERTGDRSPSSHLRKLKERLAALPGGGPA